MLRDALRRDTTPSGTPWMLTGDPGDGTDATPEHVPMSKRTVLTAVARRGGPRLIEATLVPALLFFVAVLTMGPVVAMVVVLVWGYGAIIRRLVRGESIPAILVLATLGLTVKTFVGLASGSTFAYFVQPVATTVVLAFVFLGSVVIGRPIIGHLAHDFCPLSPDIARRQAVARLFSGLTHAVGARAHRHRNRDVRDARVAPRRDVRRAEDCDELRRQCGCHRDHGHLGAAHRPQ